MLVQRRASPAVTEERSVARPLKAHWRKAGSRAPVAVVATLLALYHLSGCICSLCRIPFRGYASWYWGIGSAVMAWRLWTEG